MSDRTVRLVNIKTGEEMGLWEGAGVVPPGRGDKIAFEAHEALHHVVSVVWDDPFNATAFLEEQWRP